MGTIRHALRFATGLALACLVAWLVVVALVLVAGARPELSESDAIVVMGAAQYNGRPSPVLKSRVDHAIDLWGQGLAPRILFTGGVGRGDTLSEAEVARRYALDSGVPDSAILIEARGRTSAESMGEAARILRARSLESALLVSDPFHMLRLEMLARRGGLQGNRAPVPSGPIERNASLSFRYVLRESVLVPIAAVQGPRTVTSGGLPDGP
ncbi:MAG TPA: YdcF family protein [Longimicrobiales bacterium]|nr:YdcF family protein [Longimicrobiales bacterium]